MGTLFSSPSSSNDNEPEINLNPPNTPPSIEERSEDPLIDIVLPDGQKSSSTSICQSNNCFSLLSYNILAEVYSYFLRDYVHSNFLDISYRSALIVKNTHENIIR